MVWKEMFDDCCRTRGGRTTGRSCGLRGVMWRRLRSVMKVGQPRRAEGYISLNDV